MKTCIFLFILIFSATSSAGDIRAEEKNTYTLYRNSATSNGETMRIHVATFDADQSNAYNRENCEVAKKLFTTQPGVIVYYWCEPGVYRKK
jgi:hypothetical protein